MDQEASPSRAFREVDATANPSAHVRYLQAVSAQEHVQAIKRRSIDRLELRPGARVLEVGCGVGDDVRLMAQRVGRAGRAVGIDRSAATIAEAQRRSAGLDLPVEFRVGDIYRLDEPAASFDGCRESGSCSTSTTRSARSANWCAWRSPARRWSPPSRIGRR